ncbi:hypothetical protein [Cecembia calidifontis]|uniref:Uncharacterized protein n=1 Tax=Cecembia calidifontis TaxID=1187080 RepID=A0A4Q7PG62_9BACT|nr:hypothetical protein [Cecembia calidifontis]RZS97882.1 hypothetical protein BC751_3510 [Cecembia calidifontis]
MANKIILADVGKWMFPECYPYFKNQFQEELNYLHQQEGHELVSLQNMKFKIKLAAYSSTLKDEGVRYVLHKLFNNHVDTHLDWQQEYNWYELKSILMFFIVFSTIQRQHDLAKLFDEKSIPKLFDKYTPRPSLK